LRAAAVASLVFLVGSCASVPKSQPQIDALVISTNYEQALQLLNNNPSGYGKNNRLLYLLDKGIIEHYNRNYQNSIDTFYQAQLKFDELYTESVSKIALTWVINDYSAPYHGEDFEHVLINVFQALNYVMLGKYNEALVEARDVDSKLSAINAQYRDDQKNVYKEDAFARMLMGIIYETEGSKTDLNDAFVSYVKAAEIYENDYRGNYGVELPEILKENILTSAQFMGWGESRKYKKKYPDTKLISLKEKKEKAEVYLIHYNGISPLKVEGSVTIPTLNGSVVKVAFPRYQKRSYATTSSRLLARNKEGEVFQTATELGEDIGAIAVENLDRRKARFIAKSALKATGRYFIEEKQEENIQKKNGSLAASWFRFFANMYNLVAEKADLRSWQSLPDQIRIARLLLEPGDYTFSLESFNSSGAIQGALDLQRISVQAGEKVFFLVHTPR